MNDFNIEKQPKMNTGFILPENYFENFSETVIQKIQQSEPKVIVLKKDNKWRFAVAAIIIVSLGLFSVYRISTNQKEADSLALENYIANYVSVSDEEFINLLDETDIQEINISTSISDTDIEDILTQNSNVEQYLIN